MQMARRKVCGAHACPRHLPSRLIGQVIRMRATTLIPHSRTNTGPGLPTKGPLDNGDSSCP